tara:strand:+ start:644 stop:1075 length:432 start_codon:yes stop_codon:yes gene_type:complete
MNFFYQLKSKLIKGIIALCLGFLLILSPFGLTSEAASISMSGDFVKDTVSVAQSLKETIATPEEEQESDQYRQDAIDLITSYISRYRNRPTVNGTTSFTTMQTALNAMAGHYKTFANRPIPEKLKDRLNKELSRAEKIVVKEI